MICYRDFQILQLGKAGGPELQLQGQVAESLCCTLPTCPLRRRRLRVPRSGAGPHRTSSLSSAAHGRVVAPQRDAPSDTELLEAPVLYVKQCCICV